MDKAYTPTPDQAKAIKQILKDKSHLCAADVGAGKTIIAVEAALQANVDIVLVIAPLNTDTGWKSTVARQSQGSMPFKQINSTKSGILAFQDITDGVRGVYFIGTEYFRRLGWNKVHLDYIVVDEGHRFQNRNSQNFEVLKTTTNAEYKVYLSATPAGNRVEGLWAGLHWLWPEKYKYFWPWVTKYMTTEMQEHRGKKTKKVVAEVNPGAAWKDIPSTSKFKSPYQDKPIIREIHVPLTPAQRKVYKKFEEEAVVWLEENPLVAKLPAIKTLRLREMLLAVPSIKQDWIRVQDPETGLWSKEWGDVVYFKDDAKSSKLDALFELLSDLYVEESPPVLVFCHSRKFVDIVVKRLQDKGYRARRFVGGMSPEERKWKKEAFGYEFDILVATHPTVAEGTDGLQLVSHDEVWLSVNDNRVLNKQALGRLSRPGQKKTVRRYYIRAAETLETDQISRLESDEALLESSLNAEEVAA